MNNAIVLSMQASFQHAYNLLEKFVGICPDEIWTEKSGGWPVWQQVLHTLTALDFFVRKNGEEAVPVPRDPGVASLAAVGDVTLPKNEMLKLATVYKARVYAYIADLTDADLSKPHSALSARFNRETLHCACLNLLAGHTLYHLGSCDAALRNHGLQGVF